MKNVLFLFINFLSIITYAQNTVFYPKCPFGLDSEYTMTALDKSYWFNKDSNYIKIYTLKQSEKKSIIGQQYCFNPYLNKGSYILSQLYPDTQVVNVEIYNSSNINMYKTAFTMYNGSTYMKFKNLIPDSYMLKITDYKNNCFNIKFIVE